MELLGPFRREAAGMRLVDKFTQDGVCQRGLLEPANEAVIVLLDEVFDQIDDVSR